MNKSTNNDPFEEFDNVTQKMKQIRDEIEHLLKDGKYDEAIEKADNELRPICEEWRKAQKQAFINLRNHPNIYHPK